MQCETIGIIASDQPENLAIHLTRLSQQSVILYIQGWPSQLPKVLQPYHTKLAELSVKEGCFLWGRRVIIPQRLQKIMLQELHREHMGIARMKALARSHVWWMGLECLAKSCPEYAA